MVVALDPLVGLVFSALIKKHSFRSRELVSSVIRCILRSRYLKTASETASGVIRQPRSKDSCSWPYDNLKSVLIQKEKEGLKTIKSFLKNRKAWQV